MTFDDFAFDDDILDGLYSMGFNTPTPIQAAVIPEILAGNDVIACAQTGTGKTAAYLLPVLQKINEKAKRSLNTLIIAPTRELALQIDQQIEGLSYYLSVSSIPVYGGGDGNLWIQQKRALDQGADLIVATPGRLISLLSMGEIKFDSLEHLILDEADRMLDMGFFEDIMKIISYLPSERQTLLFSATMPPKIRTLASRILRNPKEVNIAISKPASGILQQAYVVYDPQKEPLLRRILSDESYQSVIIFASTKEKVKLLDIALRKMKFSCRAFHSDLEQAEREQILREFKNRQLRILVGTDVLSRGIDIEGISLVVNFDSPPDPEDYVHRVGRTARAASTGTAITFINEKDQRKFSRIEELIGIEVPKIALPEELGAGPLYQPKLRRPEHSHRGSGNKDNKNRKPFRRNKPKPKP